MICCLSLTSVNFLSKIWTKWWISQLVAFSLSSWKASFDTLQAGRKPESTWQFMLLFDDCQRLLLLRSNWIPSQNELSNAEGRINKSWSCFLCSVMIISQTEWLLFASHAVCFCSVSPFLHWISCIFFLASFQMLRCKERRFVKSFSKTGVISPWSDLMCIWLIQFHSRRENHLSWLRASPSVLCSDQCWMYM